MDAASRIDATDAKTISVASEKPASLRINVGPTVRPTEGTPAFDSSRFALPTPASLDGQSDGPPTFINVGPTVRPTEGTPVFDSSRFALPTPASLDGQSDGPPTS